MTPYPGVSHRSAWTSAPAGHPRRAGCTAGEKGASPQLRGPRGGPDPAEEAPAQGWKSAGPPKPARLPLAPKPPPLSTPAPPIPLPPLHPLSPPLPTPLPHLRPRARPPPPLPQPPAPFFPFPIAPGLPDSGGPVGGRGAYLFYQPLHARLEAAAAVPELPQQRVLPQGLALHGKKRPATDSSGKTYRGPFGASVQITTPAPSACPSGLLLAGEERPGADWAFQTRGASYSRPIRGRASAPAPPEPGPAAGRRRWRGREVSATAHGLGRWPGGTGYVPVNRQRHWRTLWNYGIPPLCT